MNEGLLHLAEIAERSPAFTAQDIARIKDMQSKDGLHPYRAALLFILREQQNHHHTSRKARAAVDSGNVGSISQFQLVRCIAHAFGKSGAEVARDLIDTYRALEVGQPAP